jgi:hypothetical protein
MVRGAHKSANTQRLLATLGFPASGVDQLTRTIRRRTSLLSNAPLSCARFIRVPMPLDTVY